MLFDAPSFFSSNSRSILVNIWPIKNIYFLKNVLTSFNNMLFTARYLIMLSLALIQFFLCVSASAMEVWWNPDFKAQVLSEYKIKSFDASDIKKAMKLVVYKPYKPIKKQKKILGCPAIKLIETTYNWDDEGSSYLASALDQCQLLERIMKAKPAAEDNGIDNYRFSTSSLNDMPACFHDEGEPSYMDSMDKAHARGESLTGSDFTFNKITKQSDWEIQIDSRFDGILAELNGDNPAIIRILGKADFNSDGISDILVSYDNSRYFMSQVLSKKKGDTVFRVLNSIVGLNGDCEPTWGSTPSPCRAPDVAKARDGVEKIFKQNNYEEAIKATKGYIQKCGGDISDVSMAWLLNDLALAEFGLGNPKSCLEKFYQINQLYYYAGGPALESAMSTSYELCSSAIGK
jgi:hypothetical protein